MFALQLRSVALYESYHPNNYFGMDDQNTLSLQQQRRQQKQQQQQQQHSTIFFRKLFRISMLIQALKRKSKTVRPPVHMKKVQKGPIIPRPGR